MNISKREKVLLLLFFYVLLIGGLFKFVYFPVNDELAEARKENHRLEKEIENIKQAEENEGRAIAAWQAARAEYNALESRIPQEPDLVDFIAYLEQIAVESNVSLTVLSYNAGETDEDLTGNVNSSLAQVLPKNSNSNNNKQENKDGEDMGPSQLTFAIGAAGRYYSLLNFLQEIKQSPRIISIINCSLSAAEKKQGKHINSTQKSEEAGKAELDAYNAPPPVPLAKGNRISAEENQDKVDASTQEEPMVKAREKYDASNFQMQLKLRTYYAAGNSRI